MGSELTVSTGKQDLDIIKGNSMKAIAAKKTNQGIIRKTTVNKIRKHHYAII